MSSVINACHDYGNTKFEEPGKRKGIPKHKHIQFLTTETGIPHLDKQVTTVTALLRISEDKQEFGVISASRLAGRTQNAFC
jgi:hypothetical protein